MDHMTGLNYIERYIMKKTVTIFALIGISLLVCSCANFSGPTYTGPPRTFATSFESISDFDGFYIVPQGSYDSNHDLSTLQVYDGTFSHRAWVVNARASNNDGLVYLPHRAYPTIQLQKTTHGIYRTPCLISLWVYLDMPLADRPPGSIDDWFSFVTLTPDSSDNWARTVLVNLTYEGHLRLVHVPRQGEQIHLYQASTLNDPGGALLFPQRVWVRLDVLIDFSASGGYAKVWQNQTLVSHANVEGGNYGLAQAHFGMYSSAAIASGTIYNDKLRIREVSGESEALTLINSAW